MRTPLMHVGQEPQPVHRIAREELQSTQPCCCAEVLLTDHLLVIIPRRACMSMDHPPMHPYMPLSSR